jgi:hypothetical protein
MKLLVMQFYAFDIGMVIIIYFWLVADKRRSLGRYSSLAD